MSLRTHTYNAYETTTAAPLNIGSTSVLVASTTGLTAPLYLVVDPDVAGKREWIRVGTINASTFEDITRNLTGSVGDVEHTAGAVVRAVFTMQHLDDLFTDIEAFETADSNHAADAGDPHAAALYAKVAHTIQSHSDTTGTGAELDTLTGGGDTTLHSHAHSATTGQTANDHHNELHTIASHSDTTATGAELDALTDGGQTALHSHGGILGDVTPPGSMMLYGGASAPSDWLLCDGASVSQATYAALYTVIGLAYGNPGGGNFNLPDLRQRFPLGKADAGTGSTLGATGGAIDHTHTGPSHVHTMPTHTHTVPSHTHTMGTHTHTGPSHTHGGGAHTHAIPHTHTMGTHTHYVSGTTSGPSGTFGTTGGASTVGSNSHTHSWSDTSSAVDPGDTNASSAASSGSSGTQNTLAGGTASTGATDPGDTNAGGTGNTGTTDPGDTNAGGTGATGIQNPPFVVVNYIIKT